MPRGTTAPNVSQSKHPCPPPCIRGIHTRYPSVTGAGGRPSGEARMSVRQALLALLEQGPMYGYQLRAEFEQRTGSTWPLNVGQVYTTLTRLERDGLVERRGGRRRGPRRSTASPPAGRDEVVGVVHHAGGAHPAAARRARHQARARRHRARRRRRARSSSSSAAPRWPRCRTTPGSSAAGRAADAGRRPSDLAWSLVLDSLVFAAEAEIRWLDHCEARLRRAAVERADARRPVAHGGRAASRPRRPADERRAAASTPSPASTARARPRCTPCGSVSFARARRRAGRRDGPVGLRQVDPAHPGRRARPADRRHGVGRGHRPGGARQRRAARGCGVRRSATSSRTST